MRITLQDEPNPLMNILDIPFQYTNVEVPAKRFTIVVDLAAIFNLYSPPTEVYKMKIICGPGVQKLNESVEDSHKEV